jgi:hypothetical protein
MKWITGEYLFTGHSLLLFKVFEWNDANELKEVVILQKHELQVPFQ